MNNVSFFDVVYHDTELKELKIEVRYNGSSRLSFILEDTENNLWKCSFKDVQRIESNISLNHTVNAILLADISTDDLLYKSFVDFFKAEKNIHCYIIETTSGTIKFLTKDCGEFIKYK